MTRFWSMLCQFVHKIESYFCYKAIGTLTIQSVRLAAKDTTKENVKKACDNLALIIDTVDPKSIVSSVSQQLMTELLEKYLSKSIDTPDSTSTIST